MFATDNAQPAVSQPSKCVVADERVDKIRGFMKYERSKTKYRPASSRRNDWAEVAQPEEPATRVRQAARCMDCGVPFCQSNTGCPIGNLIPEFNELVFQDQWKCFPPPRVPRYGLHADKAAGHRAS
jgi:glutamate synthase (NADPH/NADH)